MNQPQPARQPEQAAYTQAVANTRARLLLYAAAAWAATPNFEQSSLALLVDRIVPAVTAAQMQVANLTAAFFARTTGRPPTRVDRDIVTGGRGVPATTVYARPVIAARSVLAQAADRNAKLLEYLAQAATDESSRDYSEPTDLDVEVGEARKVGQQRLESLIVTDLQLAKVRQSDVALRASGRSHYRRVPTSDAPCALCLIASTQRYKVGNLLPIHPGCQCEAHEIPAGMDLNDLFDADALLKATHAKVEAFAGIADRGGRAVDYRKLLITNRHGELGDVIGWRGENFTGSRDLGRTGTKVEAQTDIARRHLPGLLTSLQNLRDKGLAEDSPQIAYHLNQIARFTADLNT